MNQTTFPSYYPNRAVCRAVRQNRLSRLSGDWRAFIVLNPQFATAIKAARV